MNAIEGSTVKCATLVDGTLRLTIDFEPPMTQEAFRLFGTPGRGVAVAALHDGRAALLARDPPAGPKRAMSPEQRDAMAERWHAKGPLERAAIELCEVPEFQEFVGADNAKEAAVLVKDWCGIETRKVLDTDPEAGAVFHEMVLEPYRRFQAERAGQAHGGH